MEYFEDVLKRNFCKKKHLYKRLIGYKIDDFYYLYIIHINLTAIEINVILLNFHQKVNFFFVRYLLFSMFKMNKLVLKGKNV